MFLVNIPKINYTDPWKSSFADRLSALSLGEKRVAYYYEAPPDAITFRYRVYNMIQVLQESQNRVSAAYFSNTELDQLDKVVELTDILVISRSRYSDGLNRIVTKARNKGKTVLFDIDDLVFNPQYIPLLLYTLDEDLNQPSLMDSWFAAAARYGALLSICDGAITTNKFLADRLQSYSGIPISIIPNFLNREQLQISEQIYERKKSGRFKRNNQIHLGYFSGTPTHSKDFAIMSDALERLLKNIPHVVIRIVGHMALEGPLKNYESRIERYAIQDFVNLQRLIGEVEINLAPLQDNEFTNCKSELKYFEAGIVGTVTIATPIFAYKNSIYNGENGYLAKSFEWYEKIGAAIEMLDSYSVIAEKAYKDAKERFAWYNQLTLLEETLFSKIT